MKLFPSRNFALPNREKRTAAAVAEFACIAPLFALVLMGMIELSRGLMVKVILSDAARKGCRTGTRPDKANTDILSDCTEVMRDNQFNSSQFNPNSIGQITIQVTDPKGNALFPRLPGFRTSF
jgi:Flp pilus assembly protein TadG